MAGLLMQAVGYKFDYDDFHSFVDGLLAYKKLTPTPPAWRLQWPLLHFRHT